MNRLCSAALVVIMGSVPVHAQTQETKKSILEDWEVCKVKLSKGSSGVTPEELRECKKTLAKALRLGLIPPNTQAQPAPQKTMEEIVRDPDLLRQFLEEDLRRANLRPVTTGYYHKWVDIHLVERFKNEQAFQSYPANKAIWKKDGRRVRALKDSRGATVKLQFLSEQGEMIMEKGRLTRDLSEQERNELRPIIANRMNKNPSRGRIIPRGWEDAFRLVSTNWYSKEGFLLETEAFTSHRTQGDVWTVHVRTNIYEGKGKKLCTIEGESVFWISPNHSYLVALDPEYPLAGAASHLAFYDIKGTLLHEHNVGGASFEVAFSKNSKYVAIPNDWLSLFLFDNNGNLLWKKTQMRDSYVAAILDNGHVLTSAGELINQTGAVLWEMEAYTPIRAGDFYLDESKKLLLTTLGMPSGKRPTSAHTSELVITDFHNGKALETISTQGFPGDSLTLLEEGYLKVVANMPPDPADRPVYLYKVAPKR